MANISITGNIGRDPELRQAGTSQVLKFSVADSEYIYSKDGESPSQWYSAEVWGKQAERLAAILQKGTKVTVYGQLVQRPYTSKAGKEGISMDIKDGRVSIVSKKEAPAGGDAFGGESIF
jgi:single-strand DNA-binding protein